MLMVFKLIKPISARIVAAAGLAAALSAPFACAAENSAKQLTLPEIVRSVEAIHFGDKQLKEESIAEFAKNLPVSSRFRKPAGVFVTLSKNGKSRACWGNVFPQQGSIAQA